MFSAIAAYLQGGLTAVFSLFGSAMTGFVSLIYIKDPTPALTELGELLLMGAVVGLALFGIKFVRGMIPFLR